MDEPRVKPEVEKQGQPDSLVLYRSLVWEGVLPDGFDSEFQKFYSSVSPAAERQRQNSAHFDNVAARVGSASTNARQRPVRRSDRMSPHWLKLLQRRQAGYRRLPKAAFNEPCTTRRG